MSYGGKSGGTGSLKLLFSESDDGDSDSAEYLNGDSETNLKKAFDQHVRPYIELIDKLRQEGLQQDISLPSIIVIGDQSSGKSSILEAISGVQLPRGSGIVTRCPLEMQLKKTSNVDRYWQATLKYTTSSRMLQEIVTQKPSELGDLIRRAQDEIAGINKGISNELITLKVESPLCPDLTLIDLPGIARTAVGDQPLTICKDIKQLLKDHMEKEHTIMLCVIPSNVDIAVNEALSMAKEVDSRGVRTLGVLTKPDLVDVGTESEVMAILNNERFHLANGYSIVRCRGQKDIDDGIDLKEAVEQEEDFFRRHSIFRAVNEEQRGTQRLALKLTDQLVEHIKRTLPKIREDVRKKLEYARKKLSSMSQGPPSLEAEKRLYLMKLIDKIIKEMEANIIKGEQVPSRLVMGTLAIDEDDMPCNTSFMWRRRFESFRDKIEKETDKSFNRGSLTVSVLQRKLDRYRGRELPRFINFDLFETLAREHMGQYLPLSLDCLEEMSDDVRKIFEHVCDDVLDNVPSVKGQIRGICEECRIQCMEKGEELIALEMEKENLVYTQDRTYVSELKQLEEKMSEESDKNSGSLKRMQRSGRMSFKLSAQAEEAEEFENNAQVMQQLLKVYVDVANRRIQDSIPMLIRTTQHTHYLRLLHDRLQNLAAGDNIDDLVKEDPRIGTERKNLEDKCSRLSSAMKTLNFTSS